MLILMGLSTWATVVPVLSYMGHMTQLPLTDLCTVPVTGDFGAGGPAEPPGIHHTTVVITASGNFLQASSAATSCVRVDCASASEDTKTTATMDDVNPTECLYEDNIELNLKFL